MLMCISITAEMWFGILFAMLLDIVPLSVKSSVIASFLFVMNNIGGNAPLLIEPLRQVLPYRAAIMIMYPGCFLASKQTYDMRPWINNMEIYFRNCILYTLSKSSDLSCNNTDQDSFVTGLYQLYTL